ncbi:MAG: MaoC family dehydratase N-terminal domain-containing protein [Neomegalonema sp.]|nr:MaoC family dehydratase N-terminal domain-containing protein [Neomegalonema sp.]
MSSLYFEDFQPGMSFESKGRTVTEADLTLFSMLSGDWHPIHADVEFARETRFGQRVVHGALGIAMATGQMHEIGIFNDSIVAMANLRDWQFLAPIFVGDTLRTRLEITEVEATRSRSSGKVTRRFTLLNQRGEAVQQGLSDGVVLRRVALEVAP